MKNYFHFSSLGFLTPPSLIIMKITIKTKNLELTDAIQTYVEKKIGSIKKFINILKQDTPEKGKTLAEIFIEVEKESVHHKNGDVFVVKAQVVLPGKSLTIGARSDDLYKAIIAAKDELKLEIEKYKFKKIDKNRREERKAKADTKN